MASRVIVVTWKRNLFAVTAASFIGFTGFTLVMPFAAQQLGVRTSATCRLVGISLG